MKRDRLMNEDSQASMDRDVEENASELTGDDRDDVLYSVEFDDGERQDFRWRDLRPITE
jgi:hypothetical protein